MVMHPHDVHLYTRLGLGKVEPATCVYMVVFEKFFS